MPSANEGRGSCSNPSDSLMPKGRAKRDTHARRRRCRRLCEDSQRGADGAGVPDVATTARPLQDTKKGCMSILSWNVLNEMCCVWKRGEAKRGYDQWYETRGKKIVKTISDANADVAALQEVDAAIFHALVSAMRRSGGYEGTMPKSATRWSNAIFWRSERFEKIWEESRGQRTFAVCLREKRRTKQSWVVCSVHLQGDPSLGETRVKQLHKLLGRLNRNHRVTRFTPLIVAGDFNSTASNAAAVYLRKGHLPSRGVPCFDGKRLVRLDHKIYSHMWRMESSMKGYNDAPTYVAGDRDTSRRDPIDHIFFDTRLLGVRSIRLPLSTDHVLFRRLTRDGAPPNEAIPSDHLPIACALKIREDVVMSANTTSVSVDESPPYLSNEQLERLSRLLTFEPAPWRGRRHGPPPQWWIAEMKIFARLLKAFATKNRLSGAAQLRWFKSQCSDIRKRRRRRLKMTNANMTKTDDDMVPLPMVHPSVQRSQSCDVASMVCSMMPPHLRRRYHDKGLRLLLRSNRESPALSRQRSAPARIHDNSTSSPIEA